MRLPAWLCFVFMLPLIGACQRAPVPLPVIAQGDGRVEWHGITSCADCTRIDIRLVLEREGDVRRYVLVETYVADDTGARFVDSGRWRQDAALLHLRGGSGSQRTYAVLDDGRLQSRDSHGRRLPLREDAVLSPVAP
jgi:hypothetical protein